MIPNKSQTTLSCHQVRVPFPRSIYIYRNVYDGAAISFNERRTRSTNLPEFTTYIVSAELIFFPQIILSKKKRTQLLLDTYTKPPSVVRLLQ